MICPKPENSSFDEVRPKSRLRLVPDLPPNIDERILSDVFVPRRAIWGGFSGSLAIHVAVILLVPWAGDFVDWMDLNPNPWQVHVKTMQAMNIRVPDRLYYTRSPKPSPVPAAQPALPIPARRAASQPAKPEPQRTQAEPPRQAAPPPRKFELPVSAAKPKTETLILAPPRQQLEVSARVPQVMFWARQTLQPPKPKALVLPGRSEAPAPPPTLAAPPSLEIPNQERSLSDLNVASALPTAARPALVLRPSSTAPVRLLDAPGELRGGSMETAAGDPVNLIVLSPNHLPPGRVMAVPGGAGTGTYAAPSSGKASSASASKTGQGSGNGSGATDGTGTVAIASGSPAGEGLAGAGMGSGSGAGFGDPREGGALQAQIPLPALPIKMIQPSNGTFDLVIIQSTVTESLPKTEGMLSGRPVYSVYMHIGGGKDWILQYCEPNARVKFQMNKDRVNLGDAVSIKAPYPRVILAPEVEGLTGPGYTVLHGMLSATGQLKDLTLKDGPAVMKALLPIMQKWEFRPATKNNEPTEVEVVFAIPPSKNAVRQEPVPDQRATRERERTATQTIP